MYKEHLALFMERFPALGLLAYSFPCGPDSREDFSSWPKKFLDYQALYVYGLHEEAYQRIKLWLHENSARSLIFLEDREAAIGGFLHRPLAADLLKDPQVDIHFLPRGKPLEAALQSLAEKYPVSRLEVISLPSRKTSFFRSLKLKLFRKTTLTQAIWLDRCHGHQIFFNFVRNAPHVELSFYFNQLQKAFANVPAIICGAGPSLTKAFAALKTLENRALIFACGSAIAALSEAGIQPHFCVAVDPNEEEFLRLKNGFFFETPFLYSTRVHPSVFSTLSGPFGYLRSQFGDVSQLWLEEEMELKGPLIGSRLSTESISVTMMAVAAAEWLGCNPIAFAGLDMAYTSGKRYSSSVGAQQTSKEAKQKLQTASDRVILKKDQKGKKVYSAVRWVMESSSLSKYAKNHPDTRFINTTEGGIGFKSISYQPLEELIDSFQEEYDLRGWIHAKIMEAPLPNISISSKLDELKQSLLKVIEHLSILAGQKKGSTVLAELDLKEELAFSVLFYDISHWLGHFLKNQPSLEKWPAFLEIAQNYLAVMDQST